MTSVVLNRVPVRLFLAWEEHSDALLREYVLGLAGDSHPYSVSDIARARAARNIVGELVREAEGASTGTRFAVDLRFTLSGGVAPGDFSLLQAALEDANRQSRNGGFLTLPSLPEIVAVRNWVCQEVVAQASGREPTAWTGATADTPEAPLAEWPGIADLPSDAGWIVGDDHNLIIAASPPAAALLGWDPQELVGQRVIAVIPPAFREAHVAAFTHATLTGNHRLLGAALTMQAWTVGGEELPVTVTLQRHSALRGRVVYVAWLEQQ